MTAKTSRGISPSTPPVTNITVPVKPDVPSNKGGMTNKNRAAAPATAAWNPKIFLLRRLS